MRTVNCLVGGADHPSSNGRTFERRNPVSGLVVTRAAAATLDDAQAAVAAASSAFPIWSALTPNERRRRLLKAADSLASRASEFAATGIDETGGTPGERIIVDESIADAFVKKLPVKAKTLLAGDPAKGFALLGAVASPDTVHGLKSLIEDATEKGATIVASGTSETAIMDATVVDHVTPEMRLNYEESFGPLVAVTRVRNDEQAVCAANGTEYGLSAAVFGSDTSRALQVASRIDSGICHINSATVHDEPQMPFGGEKDSGYGRFGGRAGLDEFTELRWITIRRSPTPYPI